MNYYLDKKDKLALQGIAILMMLFHHLYIIPERIHQPWIGFVNYTGINVEQNMAVYAKLCVGIFAFLTGYGLCVKSVENANKTMMGNLLLSFKASIRQLIKFLKYFWFVFLIFIPIGYMMNIYQFNFVDLAIGLIGVSNKYNGEWWYIKCYYGMLMLFPILDTIFSKLKNKKENNKKIVFAITVLITGVIFLLLFWYTGILQLYKTTIIIYVCYWIIFVEGYLFAKFRIFNRFPKVINPISILILLVFTYLFKTIFGTMENSVIDILIVPIFIYAATMILHLNKNSSRLKSILEFLGKYSLFMWLTHTFFAYYYFQKLIFIPRYSLLIYLWLIIVSLSTAVCLNRIYVSIVKDVII